MFTNFMFATGIENSIPTINNGRTRIDEMEKCGHYKLWQKDFSLLAEMDIQVLRYGPPLHTTFIGPGRYDWSFADTTFAELAEHADPLPDRGARAGRRARLGRGQDGVDRALLAIAFVLIAEMLNTASRPRSTSRRPRSTRWRSSRRTSPPAPF